MSKLENCPLCNSPADMLLWRYEDSCTFMQWGQIRCTECGCSMPKWNDIRTNERHETMNEEKSIERWNKRVMR